MLFPLFSSLSASPRLDSAPRVTAFRICNAQLGDSLSRVGMLLIVRRVLADGSTIADVATFPVPSSNPKTFRFYTLSRGRIVRDADGSTIEMDLRATGYSMNPNLVMGTSHWKRVPEEANKDQSPPKQRVLKGEMRTCFGGNSSQTIEDGFYSLGLVEALSYNADASTWRVPSTGGVRRIALADRKPSAFTQYRMLPGTEGIFWFGEGRMRLRVNPIVADGPPLQFNSNGRPVSTNVTAIALFDTTGRFVGLESHFMETEDIESASAGGEGFPNSNVRSWRESPALAPPSNLFFNILGCAPYNSYVLEELTPVQEAAYLRAMN